MLNHLLEKYRPIIVVCFERRRFCDPVRYSSDQHSSTYDYTPCTNTDNEKFSKMASDFDKHVAKQQIEWRKSNISTEEMGVQNGLKRPWILPENLWKEGLWKRIKDSLPEYLKEEKVQRHKGCHNLKSSWMLCANLYFSFRGDKDLLAGFLNKFVSNKGLSLVSQVRSPILMR